jgi:hypothetical protein
MNPPTTISCLQTLTTLLLSPPPPIEIRTSLSKMLVLDSASTLNMVCDPDLLHDIHDVPVGINVRCNAGQVTITRQGYLGDFPEPVWLHTEGIMNILSFNIVQ